MFDQKEDGPRYAASARTAWKTYPLFKCPTDELVSVKVSIILVSNYYIVEYLLPSSICNIVDYFAVVALQQVFT
jgi:hypothetical protein